MIALIALLSALEPALAAGVPIAQEIWTLIQQMLSSLQGSGSVTSEQEQAAYAQASTVHQAVQNA